MNAPELLGASLSKIQDPAAVAALFAEDGVPELPQMNVRVQGARGDREVHRHRPDTGGVDTLAGQRAFSKD